jgi:hypothetical protein
LRIAKAMSVLSFQAKKGPPRGDAAALTVLRRRKNQRTQFVR